MSGLDDLLVEGRNIIGAPYAWWGGGELEHGAPEYMGEGYGPGYVRANGVNCSGILNWLRQWVSLGPVGGTLAYGEFLDPRADYDPSRWYPVGTVCVQRYIEGVSEGHMGIVSNANQLMLQSDAYYGVNELKTAAAQHGYSPFDWAGWMPGMPNGDYLPGWTASQGVAGYPGDEATPQQTAAWMGRVAEHIYGLPAELPVMCSLVELTQGWTGPGDVKDVAGYLYAVDYDSLGWFQQRPAAGWGTPEQITDPEYALAAFLDAAWDAGPPGGPLTRRTPPPSASGSRTCRDPAKTCATSTAPRRTTGGPSRC